MNQMSQRERNRLDRQERILAAAITVFSRSGFAGASMDDIAEQAGLSKPTLYQYFQSKEALFEAMMLAPRDVMLLAFDGASGDDMVAQLLQFAWAYADTVMRPEFLSLARLVIGEAQRFPDVGRAYQASGPDQVLQGLRRFMEAQRDRERLRFDDAELAAEDFWGLILSAPRNRALHEPDAKLTRATLARYVHNGIRVFLRAYSSQPKEDLARLDAAIAAQENGGRHSDRPQAV